MQQHVALAQMVQAGLGVGALTHFMAASMSAVERLSDPLPGCDTQLWLLTRPDCLPLRSVQTLFDELANALRSAIEGGGG